MPIINPKKQPGLRATEKQIAYIDQLLIDVGMYDGRRDAIELRFGVRYLDEISISQASQFIEELLEKKARDLA